MDWTGKIFDTVLGGLPSGALAVVPDHVKRQWRERLDDHNPFTVISANHDLVRATRLAWIEAAQEILKEARVLSAQSEWRAKAEAINTFGSIITSVLLGVRDHALDRRKDPGYSPIDRHVQAVIDGVPELVSPGDHAEIGTSVTSGFTAVLIEISSWDIHEIPTIYGQIASNGLATHGGGPPRAFGELVFAAFAEIIKDPRKYPKAGEAFYIAMNKLGRDIGQATLAAVEGLDTKLDTLIDGLDGLEVLRDGAIRHLELLSEIAEGVDQANSKLDEVLRRVSELESIPLVTLRAILAEMGEDAETLDNGQITQKLAAKAAEFKSLTDRLNRLSNADPEVLRLRQAAAEELARGRFSLADAQLATAEARDLSGLEYLEALAQKKRLSAAESRAERASAAKLRTNPDGYREAAGHYGEAARLAQTADAKIARDYTRQQGHTLTDLGTEFGLNAALLEAIDHFQVMLKNTGRNTDALDWAETLNNLGNALRTLGERESGLDHLEEAVTAYRAALEEYQQDSVPLQWAMTQNNLGNALRTLGERESGIDHLEAAVTAYRAALEEYQQDRVPLDWAMTQNNLGNTLRVLGERKSRIDRLEEAVTAYRAALEEYQQDRVPLDWAMTQNNLGNALRALGERENGTDRLEEAVTAYRAALEEYLQDRVPLKWAMTIGNQGVAIRHIADRRNDVTIARQALSQIEKACQVMQQAGHIPYANYFKSEHAETHALMEKLGGEA